jgi:hypothetical protein
VNGDADQQLPGHGEPAWTRQRGGIDRREPGDSVREQRARADVRRAVDDEQGLTTAPRPDAEADGQVDDAEDLAAQGEHAGECSGRARDERHGRRLEHLAGAAHGDGAREAADLEGEHLHCPSGYHGRGSTRASAGDTGEHAE